MSDTLALIQSHRERCAQFGCSPMERYPGWTCPYCGKRSLVMAGWPDTLIEARELCRSVAAGDHKMTEDDLEFLDNVLSDAQ